MTNDTADEVPQPVSSEQTPTPTTENIPDDVLDAVAERVVVYRACWDCGEAQFLPILADESAEWECRACGVNLTVRE